ncbi:hypothetical protein RCH18_002199 [Flavobacterium sp. PL11]|uniref:glycosyltransferase n=1 Tax=Flavobacterium sp. PL11 TaxID=3071717 RepID=UPI002DF9868A|nr:hypothetical protein [Flavobacterium sp. PL11]
MNNQINASNINGLGASQVVLSFLQAADRLNLLADTTIYLAKNESFNNLNFNNGNFKIYTRNLPNSISRFVECFFSKLIFQNYPTIVLGDIPLRGISNQIVLVHQSNLVYPKYNNYSSNSWKFRINRFLFSVNHKYAKKIIVQTGAMAKEMLLSYPSLKNKIVVIPQPVPNWLQVENKFVLRKDEKHYLFYPAAFYPHKKHDFLLKVNTYCLKNKINCNDFEIWVTLSDSEFEEFKSIKFLKNLGKLNSDQMNEYYKRATALLFFSSMESYGLPLIEALTINLPIIVADFNYSKWVCEDVAYYFKPYDEKSFLEAINFYKKDYSAGITNDYSIVLNKFPKKWEDVVKEFYQLLLS